MLGCVVLVILLLRFETLKKLVKWYFATQNDVWC